MNTYTETSKDWTFEADFYTEKTNISVSFPSVYGTCVSLDQMYIMEHMEQETWKSNQFTLHLQSDKYSDGFTPECSVCCFWPQEFCNEGTGLNRLLLNCSVIHYLFILPWERSLWQLLHNEAKTPALLKIYSTVHYFFSYLSKPLYIHADV